MDWSELQKRVYQNKVDHGFNVTDVREEFLLLYGEVGEAFEAWERGGPGLGEELADVAIYLLGLAEILHIDLGAEVERKMEINRRRRYAVVDGVWQRLDEDNGAKRGEAAASPSFCAGGSAPNLPLPAPAGKDMQNFKNPRGKFGTLPRIIFQKPLSFFGASAIIGRALTSPLSRTSVEKSGPRGGCKCSS